MSTLTNETSTDWVVLCDGGCGRVIAVPKQIGVPVDPFVPSAGVNWVDVSRDEVERDENWCLDCGWTRFGSGS